VTRPEPHRAEGYYPPFFGLSRLGKAAAGRIGHGTRVTGSDYPCTTPRRRFYRPRPVVSVAGPPTRQRNLPGAGAHSSLLPLRCRPAGGGVGRLTRAGRGYARPRRGTG